MTSQKQRTNSSWTILFLSLALILAGIIGTSLSAEKEKAKPKTPAPVPARKELFLIKIDAPITPVVAEYIVKSIDRAA